MELILHPDSVIGFSGKSDLHSYLEQKNQLSSYNDASAHEQIRQEKAFLTSYLKKDESKIIFLDQEHGDRLVGPEFSESLPPADASWTDQNHVLVIRTADCMALVGTQKSGKLIFAVHAGWRGLEKKIVTRTIEKLQSETGFTGSMKDFILTFDFYLSPYRRKNNYEVGPEFSEKFAEETLSHKDGRLLFDMGKALQLELEELGMRRHQLKDKGWDTGRDTGLFFSHREGDVGRNLTLIYRR